MKRQVAATEKTLDKLDRDLRAVLDDPPPPARPVRPAVGECFDNCQTGDAITFVDDPRRVTRVDRVEVLHLTGARVIHMTDGSIHFESQGARMRWHTEKP
jgi:hypothetical protein